MDVPNKLYLQIEDAEGEPLFDAKTPLNGSAYTHCFERVNDSDIVYRREPEWTRVEDGLPDEGAAVWVRLVDYIDEVHMYEAVYECGEWIGTSSLVKRFAYTGVTHWIYRQERPSLLEVNDG